MLVQTRNAKWLEGAGMGLFNGPCPVCGGSKFDFLPVLWLELITFWQLSKEEVDYINRQQGFYCCECRNNLRAMALAKAILVTQKHSGTLLEFCGNGTILRTLEINTAGNLSAILSGLPGYKLITFPQFDLMDLRIESENFDIVIHSDCLEHVEFPVKALSECRRVLRDGGFCIFTIPIIVGRMTRSRHGLPSSYHGQAGNVASDMLVHTEFGSDFWHAVLLAGFSVCEIVALEFPSGLAIIARK